MHEDCTIERFDSDAATAALRVRGKLDARTTPLLLERCREVLAEGQSLVLNLSGVEFIASSGIGGLLALVEEFHEKEASVRFAELSPEVASVIDLLNLGAFLDIDDTEDDSFRRLAA